MKKNTRKLSKIIAPVALAAGCLGVLPATSCGMHSSIKQIAPYLHEITFNDYVYDSKFVTTKDAQDFGCSSVRNGNFYGRNFDYVFNDVPEFIVRVKADKKKKRHASIGVATHFGIHEDKLLKGEYKDQIDLIPNITLDGINDAGLICSHNVVSIEPNKVDGVEYKPETNPDKEGAKQLHMLFVPRYILDNAATVDEAIDLLTRDDINIMGNLNGEHNLHIMIADANRTCVVEFFHKKESTGHNHFDVVWEDKTEDNQIMTNYYLNNGDNVNFTNEKKQGDERYEILKAGYSTSNSFDGMTNLMKQVKFSIAYSTSHTKDPMKKDDKPVLTAEWYSENIDQSVLYPTFTPDEDFFEKLNKLKADYWQAIALDKRVPAEPKFWQTTHNSTYDMEKKHLRVVVQEQYEVYFDYYL